MATLAVILALVSGAPGWAATPRPEYPWLQTAADLGALPEGMDIQALAPDAARLAAFTAEGFGYVDLLVRSEIDIGADGVVNERITRVRRFLTAAGVEQGGNMGFLVAPRFDRATIRHAVAVAPDGTRGAVEPATVQVVPRLELRLFSDLREVVVPFPGLQPGSTAVLVVDERTARPDFFPPWMTGMYTRAMVPVEAFDVRVRWAPNAVPPHWATNDSDVRCTSEGERQVSCRAGPAAALSLDPDLSGPADIFPLLLISQARDWNQVARMLTALVEEQVAATNVDALAQRLTAGTRTPRERLDAIYRFVADDIRYVGLEHGVNAIVPRPPATTLRNRFGDCKDKVVLFLALARAAGLDAHAVLTATDHHDLATVLLPGGGYFNHMIACVRGVEAEEVCVDPTLRYAPAGELGVPLQGSVALDLLSSTSAPRRLPAARYAVQVTVDGDLELRCDGAVRERLRRAYGAGGAIGYRGQLVSLPAAERRRWLEEEFRQAVRAEVQPTFTLTGLETPSGELVIESDVTYPAGRPPPQTKAYRDADPWLTWYALSLRSQNHHHPVRLAGLRVRSILRVAVCQQVEPRFLGAELDLRTGFGSLTRHYERSSTGVTITSELEIPAGTVSVADIERFNRFLERSIEQSAIWFSLVGKDQA